jgi:hypothetical protein
MEQQEEERKRLMLVLGLLGLLVVLAATFVLVLVYSGHPRPEMDKAKAIAAKPSEENNPPSEQPAAEVSKRAEPAPPKPEPGPSEPAKPSPPLAESPAADDEWHDAAKSPIERGDVTIRVVSALVGIPRLVRPQAADAKPMQEFLWISVELKNAGATKVQYASWSGRGPSGAGVSLTDNLGRPCPAAAFPSGYVVEGQITRPATVDPSGAIRDVLPFRKPVELGTLKYLRLQLPAAAFGGKGTLNFEIPREMLTEAPALVMRKPAAQPGPQPSPPGPNPKGEKRPRGTSDDPPPLRLDDVEEFR